MAAASICMAGIVLSGCVADGSMETEEEIGSTSQEVGGVACMAATTRAGAGLGGLLGGPIGAVGGAILGAKLGKFVIGPACAKAFWGAVAAFFEERGWPVSARWLRRSIETSAPLTDDAEAVEKIKVDSNFRALLAAKVKGETVNIVKDTSLAFVGGDLAYAIGKATYVTITGAKKGGANVYDLTVTVEDIYNFEWKNSPAEVQSTITYLGNNAAVVDQAFGFIKNYDVKLTFQMTWSPDA